MQGKLIVFRDNFQQLFFSSEGVLNYYQKSYSIIPAALLDVQNMICIWVKVQSGIWKPFHDDSKLWIW